MDEKLLSLQNELNNLANSLDEMSFPYNDLLSIDQYNMPFLNTSDLINLPKRLAVKINDYQDYIPNESDIEIIDDIIDSIKKSKDNLSRINHSSTTYATPSVMAYTVSMLYVQNLFFSIFSFEKLTSKDLIPKKISRRLTLYNNKIDDISVETEKLEDRIKIINDAYNAAEALLNRPDFPGA